MASINFKHPLYNMIFVTSGDELLLGERTSDPHQGIICGPGGKVEDHETILGSALRELNEETGLRPEEVDISIRGIAQIQCAGGNDEYPMVVCYFSGTSNSKWTTAKWEGDTKFDPIWFPINNIPFHRMFPNDHLYLPKILCSKEFFTAHVLLSHDSKQVLYSSYEWSLNWNQFYNATFVEGSHIKGWEIEPTETWNTFHIPRLHHRSKYYQKWIFILEGNIGVGKSSIITALEEENHAAIKCFKEPNDWKLLNTYYADPVNWSIPFQYEVLHSFIRIIEEIKKDRLHTTFVMERSFFSQLNVFLPLLHKMEFVKRSDLEIVEELVATQWEEMLNNFNIVQILVQASKSTALQRIKQRRSIEAEFEQLDTCWEQIERELVSNSISFSGIINSEEPLTTSVETLRTFLTSLKHD